MNIFRTLPFRALAIALALPLAALFLAACDVGSVDSTTAVVSDNSGTIYNFAGLYVHPDNSSSSNGLVPLVFPYEGSSKPSGALITTLRLIQYGSVLEAYDSANQVWNGQISSLQGGTASFTLSGRTTAGAAVEVAGTMVYSDEQSTMNATWIEPSYYGSIFAQATVSPAATNSPSTNSPAADVTLTANSYSVAINGSVSLTASGGNGSYTWSSVSYGSLSGSGNTRSYTRTGGTTNNSATITVSSNGDDDSVTIEFD